MLVGRGGIGVIGDVFAQVGVEAVHGPARLDLVVDEPKRVDQRDDHLRRPVVDRRLERDPAGQRRRVATVQVLRRILEPQHPAVGADHSRERLGPARLEVLALVDDQQVERFAQAAVASARRPAGSAGGQSGVVGRRLRSYRRHDRVGEPLEGAGLRVVGPLAALLQQPVAELVEGRAGPGLRRHAAHRVGQRPVEADVARAAAGGIGGAQFGQGQLRLAGPGGAAHPQPERLHREPPRPGREAAGQPAVLFARAAAHRVDVRHQLDPVGQERVHVARLGGRRAVRLARARRQRALIEQRGDPPGQRVARARIDDPLGIDGRWRRSRQLAVGQVQQVVDVEPAAVRKAARELAHQCIQIARDLRAHLLRPRRVGLDEVVSVRRDFAVLLLDRDRPTVAVDDDEVDLAVEGGRLVGMRPVHAVIDGVFIGQFALEPFERFDLQARLAAGLGCVEFVRKNLGHATA